MFSHAISVIKIFASLQCIWIKKYFCSRHTVKLISQCQACTGRSILPISFYLNVFDIFFSDSLQWVNKILLHINIQRVLDLGQPLHRLPCVY